jgi:hypothetical protein
MTLNNAIETAKAKASNSPKWIRASHPLHLNANAL